MPDAKTDVMEEDFKSLRGALNWVSHFMGQCAIDRGYLMDDFNAELGEDSELAQKLMHQLESVEVPFLDDFATGISKRGYDTPEGVKRLHETFDLESALNDTLEIGRISGELAELDVWKRPEIAEELEAQAEHYGPNGDHVRQLRSLDSEAERLAKKYA